MGGFLAVGVRCEDLWFATENGKTLCQGRMGVRPKFVGVRSGAVALGVDLGEGGVFPVQWWEVLLERVIWSRIMASV